MSKFQRGRQRYFLASLADASLEQHRLIEPNGVWLGNEAKRFHDASLPADSRALTLLFDGWDPLTEQVLNPNHHRVRNAGFDCVFAAPKSVSVLFALASERDAAQIAAAHSAATTAVLSYLETHASSAVRWHNGGPTSHATNGFAAVGFMHRTSRTLDPHLHTHVLVTNLVHGVDGRWSAFDARGLFSELSAARALYGAHLRFELRERLSVVWQQRDNGFGDIVGFPRSALLAFAQRQKTITEELERTEQTGTRYGRFMGDTTRPEKQCDQTYEELVASWRERAYDAGLSDTRVASICHDNTINVHGARDLENVRIEQLVGAFDRKFVRSELVRSYAAHCAQGKSVAAIESVVDGALSEQCIERAGDRYVGALHNAHGKNIPMAKGQPVYVTPEVQIRTNALAQRIDDAAVIKVGIRDFVPDVVSELSERLRTASLIRLNPNSIDAEIAVLQALFECGALHARGIAPDVQSAAHLEAMTTIATEIATTPPRALVGALIVVHPWRIAPRDLERHLDCAKDHGQPVVMLGSQKTHEIARQDGDRTARFEQFQSDDIVVAFANSPMHIVPTVQSIRAKYQATGHDVVVATQSNGIASLLGVTTTTPTKVSRQLRSSPEAKCVIIGDARMLGDGIGAVADHQRAHVVVRAAGDQREMAVHAAEVAEPQSIRQNIGRLPDAIAERPQWRADVCERFRRDRLALLIGRPIGEQRERAPSISRDPYAIALGR